MPLPNCCNFFSCLLRKTWVRVWPRGARDHASRLSKSVLNGSNLFPPSLSLFAIRAVQNTFGRLKYVVGHHMSIIDMHPSFSLLFGGESLLAIHFLSFFPKVVLGSCLRKLEKKIQLKEGNRTKLNMSCTCILVSLFSLLRFQAEWI